MYSVSCSVVHSCQLLYLLSAPSLNCVSLIEDYIEKDMTSNLSAQHGRSNATNPFNVT